MDDMRLDPASSEPARQPEAVAASLIGQRNPAAPTDVKLRLVPPTLRLRSLGRPTRLPPPKRLAVEGATTAAARPIAFAHLDDHYQGRDQIKRGQASAEIIDLGHGA